MTGVMMGSTFDYVPVRLTKAYREAQADEKFQGWLKMQEAAVDIEFIIEDLPEIRDSMYTEDSLETVEATLIELYPDDRTAYEGDENIHRTMRYVFYIGETFRRAFEGTWAALPADGPKSKPAASRPAIDLPFGEGFILPSDLIGLALYHRSGTEITFVFGRMGKLHAKWVDEGRPERVFRGTLREDD
jgi:hypothetical protein